MDIEGKIIEALENSENPLKVSEIVEITGLDKKDIDKAIKEMKKEEKIISPKRCYYVLNN
ncbi:MULTISPECIES: MarR family transcriptional regulator [Clostridium]|uniref:MarR family transcriptional regulator n=1 Tax=Clostridium nitritogenes TaxID=83340 RepID=A0ABN1LRW1_9CLOT|nr:MarR family transcriptional regulator [Clostridium baratii]MBT9831041.1 MarR family transcriptional regulator [Clostridium baratii]MDY3206209.1 MarR family transcriptional regulator [Clostridium baratii]